jgi:hypothetical protein
MVLVASRLHLVWIATVLLKSSKLTITDVLIAIGGSTKFLIEAADTLEPSALAGCLSATSAFQ